MSQSVHPSISVVMAVYNPPLAMLDQAVDSILTQTCAGFEFILLNDGSETSIRAYLDQLRDPRVRVVHQAHGGLTRTLNRGLRLARGEFIARQDADDWSEPERFARQLAYLREHPPVALVGTDAQLHRADGQPLWRVRLPRMANQLDFLKGNPFVHGSTMYRREVALAVGGYREEFACSQDYDFFWRFLDRAEAVNLDQPLYHYRYRSGAVSAQRAADQARTHHAARALASARRRGEPEDIPAALAAADQESISGAFRASLKQADHLLLAGDYGSACRAYLHLLQTQPSSALAWAKMLRLALFAALPPAREVSFR